MLSCPEGTSAASLTRRRQLRALQAIEAAAAESLHGLETADPNFIAQPGASAFPKRLFATDEGARLPCPMGKVSTISNSYSSSGLKYSFGTPKRF